MPVYSLEYKKNAVRKLLTETGVSLKGLARELGHHPCTLRSWRDKFGRDYQGEDNMPRRPQDWSPEEKLKAIIEVSQLNEFELGEYCRRNGIQSTQIELWKEHCLTGFKKKPAVDPEKKELKAELKEIKRDLRRKEKALAETTALLVLKKKSRCSLGGRGRFLTEAERRNALSLANEAINAGARLSEVSKIFGISTRTLQRWKNATSLGDGRSFSKRVPTNRFSDREIEIALSFLNCPTFRKLTPKQLVPILADRGIYIGSESTLYRILRKNKMLRHRHMSRPVRHKRPCSYSAVGPNQVWTWDITYLKSTVKGQFYFLYMIVDIFSRKITGWEIYERESDSHATEIVTRAYLREKIVNYPLVLHSDNGSPMKGATLQATLQRLGIISSFSRPRQSNDNPYSESLFRTLKYRSDRPIKPFETINDARHWVNGFVSWYNNEHLHSAIQYVTPQQKHTKQDINILNKRKRVYEKARARNPHRWTNNTRNWQAVKTVFLNPEKQKKPALKPKDTASNTRE